MRYLTSKPLAFYLTVCAGFLVMASNVSAQSSAQEAEKDTIRKVDYYCERGVMIPVTYINTQSGAAFAVIHVEGKQVPMRIAISASGARYIALDEQDSYRWHEKGGEGVLSHMEADHTAQEQVLLSNCRADEPEEE